ncbi:MAG: hypothetical protein HYV08_12025 [Deltaproteobacteria bacterium]|nr:hypothetical protein [Deltaproteobacteria bacterium]
MKMAPGALSLINALNGASEKLGLPKVKDAEIRSLNCKRYFQAVGRALATGGATSPGGELGEELTNPNLMANDIVMRLRANASGQWQEIDGKDDWEVWERVQALANQGALVVGASTGTPNGHLAVVSPIPPTLKVSDFEGKGPFVRDGNEHFIQGRVYASTWGAVEASKAFDTRRHPPTWHVWAPSLGKSGLPEARGLELMLP